MVNELKLDAVFSALADPTRRRILERLARKRLTVGEIASEFPISQPAISKHVRVLEESDIERVIVTNTIPLAQIEAHPKFVQLSIAQTFADTISRITTNRSVSALFDGEEGGASEPGPNDAPVLETATA